jgi:hypothetical protein
MPQARVRRGVVSSQLPRAPRREPAFALGAKSLSEYACSMSTLAEIEAVVEKLSAEDKQELLLFLAARLRGETGALPKPRKFSPNQLKGWISDDEAEMNRIRDHKSK